MRARPGRRHGRGYAEAGDGSVKIELYITNDDPVTAEAQALIAAAVAKAGVADPQVETRVVGTADDALPRLADDPGRGSRRRVR